MKINYNSKKNVFSIEDIKENDDFVLTLNEQERKILADTEKLIHYFYYGK